MEPSNLTPMYSPRQMETIQILYGSGDMASYFCQNSELYTK